MDINKIVHFYQVKVVYQLHMTCIHQIIISFKVPLSKTKHAGIDVENNVISVV